MIERNRYIYKGNDVHLDFELELDGEAVHDLRDVNVLEFYLIDMDRTTVITKSFIPNGGDIEIDTPKHGSVRVHLTSLDTSALGYSLYRMAVRAQWNSRNGRVPYNWEWPIESVLYVRPSASVT